MDFAIYVKSPTDGQSVCRRRTIILIHDLFQYYTSFPNDLNVNTRNYTYIILNYFNIYFKMYLLNSINSTTLFDYSYTYHYSKYSCSTAFYFVHVIFCYIIFLSGLGAFITRLHPKIKPAHQWFGRVYILSMLYATATSLLIHNTGLPLAVLYSFVICIGGLTIAWILILLHKSWLYNLALKNVYNAFLKEGFIIDISLNDHINTAKMKFLNKRTLAQRIFSYKAFHGMFMFMSWINITGRIFASDQSGDFQCYTYPIYKVGNDTMGMNQSIIEFDIVPENDPNYDRLPWAHIESWWAVIFSVGVLVLALVFGSIWSCVSISAESSTRLKTDMKNMKNMVS